MKMMIKKDDAGKGDLDTDVTANLDDFNVDEYIKLDNDTKVIMMISLLIMMLMLIITIMRTML